VVVMKSSTFRNIMPCSPLKTNQRFGGTLHPSSGLKSKSSKKQARSRQEAKHIVISFCKLQAFLTAWFMLTLYKKDRTLQIKTWFFWVVHSNIIIRIFQPHFILLNSMSTREWPLKSLVNKNINTRIIFVIECQEPEKVIHFFRN
jgi:hypothetical protein